ncbi:hypothetical protein [Bacillus sp. 1P06AnD]|uniref:hypothetical protein n=1 Tax=Bacillus sp. 1P06AnD TaxID=3132208 RepID=UPI0039A3B590
MDLNTIKKKDDSVWLYILKNKTVFDTELIKAEKDWLIKQAEKLENIEKAWREGTGEDVDIALQEAFE